MASATQYLGIAPADFWELTPCDLKAMYQAQQDVENLWNQRFGLLATLHYNAHRKPSSRPIQPDQWFGRQKKRAEQQSVKQSESLLMQWAAMVKKSNG